MTEDFIPNGTVSILEIDAERHDQRIDNFLITKLKGVPRTHIYRLIRKGEVRVNKKRINPAYRLQTGDFLRIPPVRHSEDSHRSFASPRLVSLLEASILYEDQGLIIINKPSGLAVHGGSGVNLGVIEAFRQIRPQERILELVHRLDRDTSGCLMIAKKPSLLRELHALLRNNQIRKTYHALVKGSWQGGPRRVTVALRKNILSSGERIVRIDKEGKASETLFTLLENYHQSCLVEAKPLTGRTHQIRVHANYLHHPILGDEKYGDSEFNRQMSFQNQRIRLMLHAASLSFHLPSHDRRIEVKAPTDILWTSIVKSCAR
jgi:23S rRNA pseudouridine955/2504/2580 synthase